MGYGRNDVSLAVTAMDLLLSRNARDLEECGFYYGDELDVVGCRSVLGDMPEGTFLLRDSSHHEFVYALSVNVGGGCVRSIRIGFGVEGRFYLDWCGVEGEGEGVGGRHPAPPTFSSVLSAVGFLIGVSGAGEGGGGGEIFRHEHGRQLGHFSSRTHRLGWTECGGAFRRLLVKTPLLRATCMDV